MATADQIPTDLALEIGVDVSPDRFMAAARAFFGYVEELGKALAAGEGDHPSWIVRIRDGSNLIGVEPSQTTSVDIVRAVYERAERGVLALANGDIGSAQLPDPALAHLRVLSELMPPIEGMAAPIRLWIQKHPIALSPEIGETIRAEQRTGYRDYGTVEGKLEAIQDRGGLKLRIRDALLKLVVECSVPEEMLDQAFRNFRKRVEVSGLISYQRNGWPTSIDVSAIERLPEDSELPSVDEMRGIMRLHA